MTRDPARIAVLTPYSSVDYVGGTEVFNDQLESALGELEIFADPETRATAPRWHPDRIGMAQPYEALRSARSFLRVHRNRPFQLVICNGLYGWPLAFTHLDIPAVQVYHFTMAGLARHALSLPGDRLTTGTVSAFFDRLAGRGKSVVAVSHAVHRELESYYRLGGRVIPNAVDTALFRKHDKPRAREDLGLPADGPIGLFVGRPEFAKGFDIFLEVAGLLPEITFVVVGRYSGGEANVRVLGDIPHAKMPLCYSAADFLLLPSRYEGFGLSILEALACDLPFVVSKAAYNLPEEPSRYGYVVGSLRPQEFAQGIQEVLSPSSSYGPGKALAAAYNLDVFRRNWGTFVESLLERSCETQRAAQ